VAEVQAMQAQQVLQVGYGIRVIVDPVIDPSIVETVVPGSRTGYV
jgi:hypothetical protein